VAVGTGDHSGRSWGVTPRRPAPGRAAAAAGVGKCSAAAGAGKYTRGGRRRGVQTAVAAMES
jgi:hypothetical protein